MTAKSSPWRGAFDSSGPPMAGHHDVGDGQTSILGDDFDEASASGVGGSSHGVAELFKTRPPGAQGRFVLDQEPFRLGDGGSRFCDTATGAFIIACGRRDLKVVP